MELNVSSVVMSSLAAGYPYLGFKFIADSQFDAFGFVNNWIYPERRSGVYYDTAVVPAPAAVWLLGTGILSLAALRRKIQHLLNV